MQLVTNAADDRIADYLSLRRTANKLKQRGLLVVEGPEAIKQLLESPLEIESFFFDDRYHGRFEESLTARKFPGEKIFVAPRSVMSEIIGYRLHRGVLAIARQPAAVPAGKLELPVVALNGLADSENVGSVIRSAAGFGIRSFLVDETTADPYLRRCIRVSTGAVLSATVSYARSLPEIFQNIDPRVEIVAVEQSPASQPVWSYRFSKRSIFVFGKERGGIDREVLDCCSAVVSVPMASKSVDSLNVGCAAAVVLAHFFETQNRPDAVESESAYAVNAAGVAEFREEQ